MALFVKQHLLNDILLESFLKKVIDHFTRLKEASPKIMVLEEYAKKKKKKEV